MNTGYHCTTCHEIDPNFFWEGMRGKCKEHYSTERKASRRAKKDWLREIKETTPCADCGIQYPFYVMDFDHIDPHKKEFNIASKGCDVSWKRLREEVARCDVVCANCHRQRTFELGLWSRDDDEEVIWYREKVI